MFNGFCVDIIRSVFCDCIAISAVNGKSVKACYFDALAYLNSLTGLTQEELIQIFPSEYIFKGTVYVRGESIEYTVTKSRFELYPIVS